jgi:hypothetical protein
MTGVLRVISPVSSPSFGLVAEDGGQDQPLSRIVIVPAKGAR